jgi:hypothetical protein
MTGMPRDRGDVSTEGVHARADEVDGLDTPGLLGLMADEDRVAADAVRAIVVDVARFVDALAERFGAGGRLIYVGAGTSGRLGVLDASECPPDVSGIAGPRGGDHRGWRGGAAPVERIAGGRRVGGGAGAGGAGAA